MRPPLTLASHPLCPYVQRAAIVLHEKGMVFERCDIDLADKPAWFLRLSPLGKTPLLLDRGEAIFESAAICEYLEDTTLPRLHPADPMRRARHRAWMEFGSVVLNGIAAFYGAADETALAARAAELHARFEQVEAALGAGPWFDGTAFSIVDAVFGPVFRYFDTFDGLGDFGCLTDLPKVQAWRSALAQRESVQRAAGADHSVAAVALGRTAQRGPWC